MPRLFRRASVDELASAGKTAKVLKALQPRDRDFIDLGGREILDVGADRRAGAARHLGAVDGAEVSDALAGRLVDYSASVRLAALRSLTQRSEPLEAAMVDAILDWPEETARVDGAALLLERADSDGAAAARIAQAYVDSELAPGRTLDDDWARSLLDVLDDGGKQTAVERAIERALPDHAGSARARQCLVTLDALALGVLLGRLERRQEPVLVAGLLGVLRLSGASAALTETLLAVDPRERAAAARALGAVQDPRTVPDLLSAAADPVFDVRDAAQKALDGMGTAGVVWGVAAAARGALGDVGPMLESSEPGRRLIEGSARGG